MWQASPRTVLEHSMRTERAPCQQSGLSHYCVSRQNRGSTAPGEVERTRLRLEPHTTGALGPGLLTAGPRPAPGWSCPGASLAGPGLTSGQQLWKAAPPLLGAGRVLCRRCPPPRRHAGLLRETKNGDAQAPTWAFPSSRGTEWTLGQKQGPENSEACTEGAGLVAAHACGCRTRAEP